MSDVVNIQVNTTPEVVNVTVTTPEVISVTVSPVGVRGLQGEQGESGQTYAATAGEDLSGGRVVFIENGKAYYFDPSNMTLYGRCLGMTTGAALTNAAVNVQMGGVLAWTGTPLTPGALYYAGAGGQLTTDPSGLTIFQRVGHAIAADKLKLNFDLNILTI